MSYETWAHKGVRRIVRPLVRTPVTPNQITMLRLLTGIGAAVAVSWGTADGLRFGAALFVVSFVLDRADGELARLSGKTSPAGHMFDLWSDALCSALIFIGLGIGLRNGGLDWWAVPMGIVAGGSIALIFWMLFRVELNGNAQGAEIGSFAGFDPDDSMLLVPLALVIGWAEGLLVIAAAAAPAFALFFFWMFRRDLQLQPSRRAHAVGAAPAPKRPGAGDVGTP